MHFYNQRIPVPLQRIEFKHILSGLQRSQSTQEEVAFEEKPQLIKKKRREFLQQEVRFFDEIQAIEQSDALQLQSSDTVWDEVMLQKLEKLRKQPNTFFEKVPKDPLTLMNSTMKNKLLSQSKEEMRRSSQESQRNLNPIQEVAVKELINNYPQQFNFTGSADARKKKEVINTRDKYLKTFFIRNSSSSLSSKMEQKKTKPFYQISETKVCIESQNKLDQNTIEKEQFQMPNKKKKNMSYQTWTKLKVLECPGYCTFVKELVKKNKRYQSQSQPNIDNVNFAADL